MEDKAAAGNLEQKLARLRASFRVRLEGMLEATRSTWELLRGQRDPAAALETQQELFALIHRISGSAGSFGYKELSTQALPLERSLKELCRRNTLPSPEQWRELEYLLGQVLDCWERTKAAVPELTTSAAFPSGGDRSAVFLVARDRQLLQTLSSQLIQFDHHLRGFGDATALTKAVQEAAPAVLLVEWELYGEDAGLRDWLAALASPPPVIFIGEQGDIATRLAAVRAGGAAYLVKPVEIDELVSWLDQFTMRVQDQPYRVLIVDDDRDLAQHHALALQVAGMEPIVLGEPFQILTALGEQQPDLILMDVYMPTCSGIDLARVVRQHRAWLSVPIVFLSVEHDTNQQLNAKSLGGDDFLTKPIDPQVLAREVASRADRSRVLRSIMQSDSLTGLLNHVTTKERLDVELTRAKRQGLALSFALVDLDHFKSVNDTYGHLAGDRVIKLLANLLSRRLRKTDVIGRYGGEEFAVILTHTGLETAAKVMNEVRESFALLRHQAESREFAVTLSCGLAGYYGEGDSADLIQLADGALYSAKAAGRNRVVMA